MADDAGLEPHVAAESNAAKWILLLLAVIYVAGSLFFLFSLRSRLDGMARDQVLTNSQIADLGKRLQSAEAENETLAKQLGITKKDLVARASELQRQQKA